MSSNHSTSTTPAPDDCPKHLSHEVTSVVTTPPGRFTRHITPDAPADLHRIAAMLDQCDPERVQLICCVMRLYAQLCELGLDSPPAVQRKLDLLTRKLREHRKHPREQERRIFKTIYFLAGKVRRAGSEIRV